MTEQDARRHACCGPLAFLDAILLAGGRDEHTEGESAAPRLCISSRCMAWRWANSVLTDGFCGLAPRPQ